MQKREPKQFLSMFRVRTLGLHVTLGFAAKMAFHIGHTDERRAELKSSAGQDVLDNKVIEPKQAERLTRSHAVVRRVRFWKSCAVQFEDVLGELSLKRQKQVTLNDKEMQAVAYLIQRVSEARAIEIGPVSLDTFLIFTDGACEGESSRIGSVGGVLVGPSGRCLQHFSSEVPTDFMREALACSANPIYELELLPIYIALHIWGKRVHSTHLVCYLDNDAARAALCKGYGSTELAQRIVGCAMQLESRFKTKSWYARVPSHSNISDGPSRLDCEEVDQLGSKQIEIDWDIILENLFGVSGASSKRGEHGHTE